MQYLPCIFVIRVKITENKISCIFSLKTVKYLNEYNFISLDLVNINELPRE